MNKKSTTFAIIYTIFSKGKILKFFKLHIILLFFCYIFYGQEMVDVKYSLDKSVEKMYNDPKKSIEFISYFFINDKNQDIKILYQNNLAQAYILQGDFLNAIKTLPDKKDIKSGNQSKFYQFFLNYCLADQYQNLGLYAQSQKVISEILVKKDFPQNTETNITLAKIYQIQAINDAILKKYNQAILNFKKSNTYIKENNQQSEILKTENQLYIASCMYYLKRTSDAELIFNQVLQGNAVKKYDFLYALTKEYSARVKFLQQKPDETIVLLNSGLQRIENQNFETLKLNFYDAISKAYLVKNNNAEYHHYQELYNSTKEKIDANKKSAISYLVNVIEDVNNEEIAYQNNQSIWKTTAIILSLLALLLGLGFTYFFGIKKEKELQKQLDFFENFEKKFKSDYAKESNNQLTAKRITVEADEKKSSLLSSEKEKELINKLYAFEESELYLSNQMSLPVLAAELDTNIKYLSEIIKNFKQKKFNAYINDLRIEWIVNKLKTDPIYLNYKVSYLAEVSGFSSHSAFTAIFRSITGMSPNDFIQQISNSKK